MIGIGFGKKLLEILYPTRAVCLGCGDEQGCDQPFLCDKCIRLLSPVYVRVSRAEWRERALASAGFIYYYGRPIRGLIRAFKFQGVRMLAPSLAPELACLLERRYAPEQFDMLIPVPLHPSRQRDRGYNQAEALAMELAELAGIPVRTDVLIRTRRTKQQAKLGHGSRAANTLGAFRCKEDLTGKRILLLDDVITTGSTVCACAEALRAANASVVHAVALAGTHACHRGKKRVYRRKK